MPKLDVTNDIDYMSIQPAEALTPLLASLCAAARPDPRQRLFAADRPVYL
jgi:hypothetical protein